MKVKYSKSAPTDFKPPFKTNVIESFSVQGFTGNLKPIVEKFFSSPLPILGLLLKIRNILVKRFGFKIEKGSGLYGPFDVEFPTPNLMVIKYDEPNFNFYAEASVKKGILNCYNAVHFKTPQGFLYFWSIYPFHVLIFKSLLHRLRKLSNKLEF